MDLRYERSIRPRYGVPVQRAASPHFLYGGPSEPNVAPDVAVPLPVRSSGAVGDPAPDAPRIAVTIMPRSEPIVLTSKNYVAGFVVGAVLGALGMHFSMKRD